jgi:hypothetical protein
VKWVPGDLAVPPLNDTAHLVARVDPDQDTPTDGTYWPWTACDRKVDDGWTASEGQHRVCVVCDKTAATDEIRILPRVDLNDMQTVGEVVGATSTFLHQIAGAIDDFAAAHDELHDHLRAIVDDERRKRQ